MNFLIGFGCVGSASAIYWHLIEMLKTPVPESMSFTERTRAFLVCIIAVCLAVLNMALGFLLFGLR